MMSKRQLTRCVAATCLLIVTTQPCLAAQDATTTGIVAGLGLTAASGKTSVSSGGGAIEATLLDSDAVLQAGDTIRRLATAAGKAWMTAKSSAPSPAPTFLVLGHNDTVDFTAARWLQRRLALIDGGYPSPTDCKVKAATPSASALSNRFQERLRVPGKGVVEPSIADIPAALATDISIQGVTVSTDDRLLVEAITIGGYGPTRRWTPVGTDQQTPKLQKAAATFVTSGEVIDASTADLIENFNKHLALEDKARATCLSPAGKAWLTVAQAFDTSATSTEKGNAPIATAAELLTIAAKRPLILHVAVEQSGGTAITRSNIFYTLGFPGAATVSAGLLVSFRLNDPVSGDGILTGFVRCAVTPVRFQNVAKIVAATSEKPNAQDRVRCSYVTS